jgi:peptidoglycan/LPS O-acetylase OafA/YrhL
MKRIEQLTFTRFVIVILVLFAHDVTGPYLEPLLFFPLTALIRSGSSGVSYLFILSGFVMTFVYYRRDNTFDYIAYWRARFTRFYPLYIISFALTCIYYYDSLLQIKPEKILANIFVVQAWIPKYAQSFNFVTWSMTVEIFFYLFFPFFLLWAYRQSTRKLIWVSLAAWAVNTVIYYFVWNAYYEVYREFVLYFPVFYTGSFLVGIVGGIWYLREGSREVISIGKALAVLAVSFLLLAVYTIVSTDFYPELPHGIRPMTGFLSPLMIFFIVALSMDKSFVSRILSHKLLVDLGEIAYALYILHIPVKWLYEWGLTSLGVLNQELIFAWTFLPLVILISYVTHFYIDAPIRRWLKSFLQTITLRVLIVDILIVLLVAFTIFPLRFGSGNEYRSYRDMERLTLWISFFALPTLYILFGACRFENIIAPGIKWLRSAILGGTLGFALVAGSAYLGYAAGWFENYPRSIFFFSWLAVLGMTLIFRLGLRLWTAKKPHPVAESQ